MRNVLVLLTILAPMSAFAVDDVPPKIWVDTTEALTETSDGNARADLIGAAGAAWKVAGGKASTGAKGVTLTEASSGPAPLSYTLTVDGPGSALSLNLDYGYYEHLQIRCKLPKGYAGDLAFQYITSMPSGKSYGKETGFAIPAKRLKADGKYHTYMMDLTLARRFRGDLRGLKVLPFGGSSPSGRSMEIQLLQLGDLKSDVMKLNLNINLRKKEETVDVGKGKKAVLGPETIQDCTPIQSKHMVIWHSPNTDKLTGEEFGEFATLTEHHRACLRMLEETYQFEYKMLGYPEPFIDTKGKVKGRHKFAVTTFHPGGWMSNFEGFPYNNFGPHVMRHDTSNNPIRHEYGHGVQGTCGPFLNGRHWESHNGYMHTCQMDYWGRVQNMDAGDKKVDLADSTNYVPRCVQHSNLQMEWRGFVYCDRRPYWYLDFDPDNLGFGDKLSVRMWMTGTKNESFSDALLRELPEGLFYGDVVVGWGRRWRTSDVYAGESKRQWYFHRKKVPANTRLLYLRRHDMMLAKVPDKANTWITTYGTSPMKMGYSQFELVRPKDGTATATVRLIDQPGEDEDIRWCFVAATSDYLHPQKSRYSKIFKANTTHEFTMKPGETNLYLLVAGTPDKLKMDLRADEQAMNYNKHPLKLCYTVELTFKGTQPADEQLNVFTRKIGPGKKHANGGGFVEDTAEVDRMVYVGPRARVLGKAKVKGNARIEGTATVIDATVTDHATVSGRALVVGGPKISGHARVRDSAVAEGSVTLSDNALLCDHARWVTGKLIDNATARGQAWAYGGPTVSGHAVLDGEYAREWTFNDGVHKSHLAWDRYLKHYDDYSSRLKKPEGLVAEYRVEERDGELLHDTRGSMHALLRGKPSRVFDTQLNAEVLQLNGKNQYVLCDASVADSKAFSFATWCKLTSKTQGGVLLSIGYDDKGYIKLIPNGQGGKCELIVKARNKPAVTIRSKLPLPKGQWFHITATLDGTAATIYVNGNLVATGNVALRPYTLITPSQLATAQANLVGSDSAGHALAARLSGISFFNTAVTGEQVASMLPRYGSMLGRFCVTGEYDSTKDKPIDTGLASTTCGTIAFEVFPTSAADEKVKRYRAIVDSWNVVKGHYLSYHYRSGMPSVGINQGKLVVVMNKSGLWKTGVPCTAGKWQTVAVTYTPTSVSVYVDGALKASKEIKQVYPAGAVYKIGASIHKEVDAFQGRLKDVQIYDKALTAEQIKTALAGQSPMNSRKK